MSSWSTITLPSVEQRTSEELPGWPALKSGAEAPKSV
jgi:hypothetical protein